MIDGPVPEDFEELIAHHRDLLARQAGPLHSLSGSDRFYNLLERNGFASVEEVAATPETCWFDLRNCGTRFIDTVRQVIGELHLGDAQDTANSLPGHGGTGTAAGGAVPPTELPAAAAKALEVMAAWAVAEHGAQTLRCFQFVRGL